MLALVLVLVLAAASAAKNLTHDGDGVSFHDKRIAGASELTVADVASVSYVAMVTDNSQNDLHVGTGIVINEYFVLVTYSVAETYAGTSAEPLHIYAGYLDPLGDAADDVNGVYRAGREGFPNPNYDPGTNPLIGNVGLIRVCPKFPSGFHALSKFVKNMDTYRDLDTKVVYYNYMENPSGSTLLYPLKSGQKWIGAKCECTYDVAWWSTPHHFCAGYDNDVWGDEDTDMDGMVVTSEDASEVLGFLMTPEYDWGEIILHVGQSDLKQWIVTNSNISPYV